MASQVDICNLALSHLGDDATVTSIDPPEGSTQAEFCKRYLPIAIDNALSVHHWSFSTIRDTPPQLDSGFAQWLYAYAVPANTITVISVMHKDATDDYATPFRNEGMGIYTPQPFSKESLPDGSPVVYTNQAEALIRYTIRVDDPTRYSPLFTTAVSYLLASYLAGPMIKGKEGQAMAKQTMQMYGLFIRQAIDHDARQKKIDVKLDTPWLRGR